MEEDHSNDLNNEADVEPMIIDRGPYFEKTVSKNVTALVGKSAYLNCRVRNVGNRTVSVLVVHNDNKWCLGVLRNFLLIMS